MCKYDRVRVCVCVFESVCLVFCLSGTLGMLLSASLYIRISFCLHLSLLFLSVSFPVQEKHKWTFFPLPPLSWLINGIRIEALHLEGNMKEHLRWVMKATRQCQTDNWYLYLNISIHTKPLQLLAKVCEDNPEHQIYFKNINILD